MADEQDTVIDGKVYHDLAMDIAADLLVRCIGLAVTQGGLVHEDASQGTTAANPAMVTNILNASDALEEGMVAKALLTVAGDILFRAMNDGSVDEAEIQTVLGEIQRVTEWVPESGADPAGRYLGGN